MEEAAGYYRIFFSFIDYTRPSRSARLHNTEDYRPGGGGFAAFSFENGGHILLNATGTEAFNYRS
jgi:hypothetical protein